MQDEKALVPIEEQTVDFYGDHIWHQCQQGESRTQEKGYQISAGLLLCKA